MTWTDTAARLEKGALVACLLDLEIRRGSSSARSLDDVLRALFREHGEGNARYELRRFEDLAFAVRKSLRPALRAPVDRDADAGSTRT